MSLFVDRDVEELVVVSRRPNFFFPLLSYFWECLCVIDVKVHAAKSRKAR